jgi:hypothetical protein
MKQILLLTILCYPLMLCAQNPDKDNGVKVSALTVTPGSPTTVTFDISWDIENVQEIWSDSVWVWVDYNVSGKMTRLPASTATASAGTVIPVPGNDKGVWVVGDARTAGSFSATVQLLTDSTDVGGACAYASNYPPVGRYTSPTEISFTGVPLYDIVVKTADGNTTVTVGSSYQIPPNATVVSFTDKTGAPGFLKCLPAATFTLEASASGFCEGDAGVTFALLGTESGRSYTLFRDGSAVATLTGTGSPATFSGAFKAGTYTAQSEADDVYCSVMMSETHNISENPLPTAPTILETNDVCENAGDLVFTAIMTDDYSGEQLFWISPDDSNIDNMQLRFASGAPTGTRTVSAYAALTYSGAPTCYSDTMMQSATIHALPANPTVTNDSRCGNGTVTISASSSSYAVIDWYATATGSDKSATGPDFTPSISTSTTYYAQARDTITGCVSAQMAVSATVNAVPEVPTDASNDSRCGPGTVTFSASVVGDNITIDWYTAASGGATVSDGYGTTSFSPLLTTGTTYYAQARDTSTGCVSESRLAVSGAANVISSMPTMSGGGAYCSTTSISASPNNGTGIRWTDTGSTVSSRTVTESGTYYAVTTATNCESEEPASVTVTINPPPTITRLSGGSTYNGGTALTVNAGSTFTAIKYTTANATGALASGLPAGITGLWSNNTFTISGSSTVTTTSKAYTVTTVNNNGCTNATASGRITVTEICTTCSFWTINDCGLTAVSSRPSEGDASSLSAANNFCSARGMRLPTSTELQCMCAHKNELPGGYDTTKDYYWSSTPEDGRYITVMFNSTNCSTFPSVGNSSVKCVK